MFRRIELALSCCLFAIALAGCPQGRGNGNNGGKCPVGCHACTDGVCHDCSPGQDLCQGTDVYSCNANGTVGGMVKQCDSAGGQLCQNGGCQSACDVAAGTHSYVGCDYWPTTTLNPQLNPEFDFAVAVANPPKVGDVVQGQAATVTVTRGAQTIATQTVQPGEVEVIKLPWVPELSQNDMLGGSNGDSALVANGAYHLKSTIPVTVYQFSPLEFEKPETLDCYDSNPTVPGMCHSYTNDASILLPTATLRTEYLVIARQTFAVDNGFAAAIPGFFTVVATEDNTSITVTYSAYTEASTKVPAQTPGSQHTYTLDKGGVLQVVSKKVTTPCAAMSTDAEGDYCDLGPKYDLTGTRILSDKPIAVFGGHACSFVPYNKWACDHLEEQLLPLDTWGQTVLVAQTKPQALKEPNLWRVVSGSDANTITFDPAVKPSVTLDAGEYIEFPAEGGFKATGTGRVSVAQFMVGENYFPSGVTVGDPAMGLGVPEEQYRNQYDFLTPSTYTKSYVNVIAKTGTSLTLDNKAVSLSLKEIGGTGYGYQNIEVPPGAHSINSDGAGFGITVSGIASYTSYLYVGGQDLKEVIVK